VDLPHVSPSHISSFTNLRTLQLLDITPDDTHADCLGGLGPVVRELWLYHCRMTTAQSVSFLRPFTNLEGLRLWDTRIQSFAKVRLLDCGELPCLKGTLNIRNNLVWRRDFAYLIHQISVSPSALHAIVFWSCDEVPREVNELLMASRRTLTKLEFPYCEFSRPAIGSAGYSRVSNS
jgi:hypothetical protein